MTTASRGVVGPEAARVNEELLMHLEGIVHFTDGFGFYRTESPAGKALEQWIEGARAAIAKATQP